MRMRTKINILGFLLCIGVFTIGALSSYNWNTLRNITQRKNIIDKASSLSSSRFLSIKNKEMKKALLVPKKVHFSSFFQKLQKNRESAEFETLFEETLSNTNRGLHSLEFEMSLLLEKWGEVAPKQALEKIKQTQGDPYWYSLVFQGWAQRDPEGAANFYNEINDIKIKNNFYILYAISQQWSQNSPKDAWNWFQSHKNKLNPDEFLLCQKNIFNNISDNQLKQIPQLIYSLDNESLEYNAYILGKKLATEPNSSLEWMNKLPENVRMKAEAGKIMFISKGNLENIQQQLSSYNETQQKIIIKELITPLLNRGDSNIKNRVNWIMQSIPEKDWPDNLKYQVENWLREDKEAKQWLDSLPSGSIKSKLKEWNNLL